MRRVEIFVEREVFGESAEEGVPSRVANKIGPLEDEASSMICRGVGESAHEVQDETPPASIVVSRGQMLA